VHFETALLKKEMSLKIELQPQVLRWVRERAGLTREDLAAKLDTTPAKVSAWEEDGKISSKRAQDLARSVHAPLGFLYLPEPFPQDLPIPDLRTVAGSSRSSASLALLETIYEAQRRQEWYKEYLIAEGEEPLDFVGSISRNSNADGAARRIRDSVGFQSEIRANAASWEDSLSLQIEEIENTGVLVMRNGIVGNNTHRPLSVDEFRGFALSDRYAPLIFLNGADSKAAQMFTLAHELVHIWLGESGISNLERTYAPPLEVERFCNSVAAKILLPDDEVRNLWPQARNRALPWEWLAGRFKVSSLVVLRKFLDLRLIDRHLFNEAYQEEEQKFARREGRQSGGGDYYAVQRFRVGTRLARAVVESTAEGKTSFKEALSLLGMKKIETFQQFAKRQFGFSF
jgi:Zn-dependent peptidase ImmA (M78 family)/DNA-binding transcriptional regulator YiaG